MADVTSYPTECAALAAALAAGVVSVTYRDRTITYASTQDIIARMQMLGCLDGVGSGSWQSRGVNPCTSKGFGGCGCTEGDQ